MTGNDDSGTERQPPPDGTSTPSQEELQALNRGLSAANRRLAARIDVLEATNDDLNHLLASAETVTVFLDEALRVRRLTQTSAPFLDLGPDDAGRPLAELLPHLEDPQLLADAQRALRGGETREAEVRLDDGRAFIRKLLPYRTRSERIEGVVLTFSEVTGLRRMADQLNQRAHQQESVVELGRIALAGEPLDYLFLRAAECLTRHLDCRFAEVLERLPGDRLLLRAGVGWDAGLAGTDILPADCGCPAAHALGTATPVVVGDLAGERRFAGVPRLAAHGVASGIAVPIGLADIWGALGVYSDRPRAFNGDDLGFVQSVAHLLCVAIERRAHTAEIERTAQRLRLALDGARMGSWEWDLATDQVTLDHRACSLFGLAESVEPLPLGELMRFVPPDELRGARRALARGRRSGELCLSELRVASERWGGDRWIGLRGRTLDGDRMIGVVEDVTGLKEEFFRREMLLAELDHRVKNILANVNAIARQTGRRHRDASEFITTLEGRIQAMAYAHSLLSASRWTGADLHSLVEAELAPYRSAGSDSVVVEGPDLLLAPKPAQSFSLALHELATNAAKHGSLSRAEGRVSIRWSVDPRGKRHGVDFEWRESGGPPPGRALQDGFGMTVLKRLAPKDLDGEAELELTDDGLSYRIRFSLGREASTLPGATAEASPTGDRWSGLTRQVDPGRGGLTPPLGGPPEN